MSDLEQSDNEYINSQMGQDSDVEDTNPLMKLKQSMTSIASKASDVFKSTMMSDDEDENDNDVNEIENDVNEDDSDDDYKPPPPPIDDDSENDDSENDDSENDDISFDGNELESSITKNKPKTLIKTNTDTSPLVNIDIPLQFEKNDSDYDSMEDEEEEDDYLQKFDDEQKNNYIMDQHPECEIHNYNEIYNLAKVQRNKDNIIVDDLHKTIPLLTKYEKTRILGLRAKQINNGAKPLVTINTQIIDGYLIALKELEEKKIPIIIRRPIPNGASEYWHLKDLEIL
jgi:DNA-directed RNA polymerase I, II, and III subunit RPABC2